MKIGFIIDNYIYTKVDIMALQASGPISIAKSLSNVDIAGLIPVFPEITTPAAPHGMDEFYSQNSSGNVRYIGLYQYSYSPSVQECDGNPYAYNQDVETLTIYAFADLPTVDVNGIPNNNITHSVDISVTVDDNNTFKGPNCGTSIKLKNTAVSAYGDINLLTQGSSGCSTPHNEYVSEIKVGGVSFFYNFATYGNYFWNRPNN